MTLCKLIRLQRKRVSKKTPSKPAGTTPESAPINPDLEFQAGLLADKVTRRVMRLADAVTELEHWQADAAPSDTAWRPVDARSLIVTHMMNALLKRGY